MLKSLNAGAIGAGIVLCAAQFTAAHAAWEPTRTVEIIVPAGPGGGADQMARRIQGIITKHNLIEAVDCRDQQVGRRRRRRLSRRQGVEGQSAQARDHAVEPVHHSARDRNSVQLQGHHAGRDDGARRIHPLGQRRQALQDRQGIRRRRQEGATAASRWAAPAPSRKTRSSPSRWRSRPAPSSPTFRYKGGGAVAVQLVGNHIDSSVNNPIEAVAHWRAGKLKPLCVFDGKPLGLSRQDRRRPGLGQHPDLQVGRHRCRVSDAARLLHAAGRHPGTGQLLCRPVQEGARNAGVEEADERRRVQSKLHDRRRNTPIGSRTKKSGTRS